MIKRLLFSIIRITSLWIISFSIISGQASIQGKVIDKEIGEGLIAAEVTLYKKDVFITGTTTDFDGNYIFTGSYSPETCQQTESRKRSKIFLTLFKKLS